MKTTQPTPQPAGDAALLPCPFCGKSDHDDFPIMESVGDGQHYIRCAWCHGSAPKKTWNRRANFVPSGGVGNDSLPQMQWSIARDRHVRNEMKSIEQAFGLDARALQDGKGAQADCGKCGGSAEVFYGPDIRFPGDPKPAWRAQCKNAECDGPTFTRRTREQAVEVWNERNPKAALAGSQGALPDDYDFHDDLPTTDLLAEAERIAANQFKDGRYAAARVLRILCHRLASQDAVLAGWPATTPAPAHGGRPMTLREVMDAEDGGPHPAAPDGDGDTLRLIADIAEGSGTVNSLPHIAKLARAALSKTPQSEDVCSCPSGDGSLRWPCKVHPPESTAESSDGGK